MSPQTIRKVVIPEFGDESKVQVVSAEISDPEPNHVQVKTIYAGFTGADVNMRKGHYPMQKKAPLTPGYCLIGTVTQNGQGATKFLPDDLVASLTVYDADAELVNLPEKYLIRVPKGLDLQQATALILDWNTAYAMVKNSAKVKKDQRVFIHGVSGAVGYATAALCRLQGAQVYGTASTRNHELLREHGITPFVYTDKKWMESMNELGGADAVFDALGFESWDESYKILNCTGTLVAFGGNSDSLKGEAPRSQILPTVKLLARNLVPNAKTTKFYYITKDDKDFVTNLQELFRLLGDGMIKVPVRSVTDLDDIQEAHRSWGKVPGIGSMLVRVSKDAA
ncbi:zinc-binding dehydrogenase [Microthyrium microscopicum]|uniref:Zinc-binding dehydrogenase n=1 Tax=Microthyrium microscopicum TaxID=703497 RepID=A0A6A6UGF1_9PEZI|nr:zinc-binding dehydrogenase [Microthyrium microscopicum]